jgi:hypothetical protein
MGQSWEGADGQSAWGEAEGGGKAGNFQNMLIVPELLPIPESLADAHKWEQDFETDWKEDQRDDAEQRKREDILTQGRQYRQQAAIIEDAAKIEEKMVVNDEVEAVKWEWWHRWSNSIPHATRWVYRTGRLPVFVETHLFDGWDQRLSQDGSESLFYYNLGTGYGSWKAPSVVTEMKRAEALKLLKFKCAVKIQVRVRIIRNKRQLVDLRWAHDVSRLMRAHRRNRKAVIEMQSAFRMWEGVLELEKMKKRWEEEWARILDVEAYAGFREVRAVTKIQSLIRMHFAFKVAAMRARITRIGQLYDWAPLRIVSMVRMFRERQKYRLVLAEWRGTQMRMDFIFQVAPARLTAVIIEFQHVMRMWMAKKYIHMHKQRHGTVLLPRKFWHNFANIAELEGYRMLDMTSSARPQHLRALARLQATFRMRLAFVFVRRKREEMDLASARIQSMFMMLHAKILVAQMRWEVLYLAAVGMQSYVRMGVAKKAIAEARAMVNAKVHWDNTCALRIQRVYRCVRARRVLLKRQRDKINFAATKVEKRWRGISGRRRAAAQEVMKQHRAAETAQRYARGFFVRRAVRQQKERVFRAAILVQLGFKRHHRRRLHRAASRIQRGWTDRARFFSGRQVHRALGTFGGRFWVAINRVGCMNRERERRDAEVKAVEDATERALLEFKEHLSTKEGKKELKMRKLKVQKQHQKQKAMRKNMTGEEKKKHEVMQTFEGFDIDSSNSIDADEFAAVMKELCVPMTEEQLGDAMGHIDDDGSGQLNFDEFYEWWTSPDFQNQHKDKLDTFKLQFGKAFRDVLGRSAVSEAERMMEAEVRSKAYDKALYEFRRGNPPPFMDETTRSFVFPWHMRDYNASHESAHRIVHIDELKNFYANYESSVTNHTNKAGEKVAMGAFK